VNRVHSRGLLVVKGRKGTHLVVELHRSLDALPIPA
jgi:hypothetical protein